MNHKQRGALDAVQLAPNFGGMRRLLKTVLFFATLAPLAYLGGSAYSDWRERFAAATDVAVRTARVVEEHAVKLFDIDVALTSRLVDALEDQDDQMVARDEYRFHVLAQRIGGGYPQISAISVFNAAGVLLATSGAYPAPSLSIGDREDLRASRKAPTEYPISGPMRSPITGSTAFNMSLARIGHRGQFEGMVTVAMQPAYYQRFYKQLLGRDDPLDIGLVKTNGALLLWYSAQERSGEALVRQASLLSAWHSSEPFGVVNVGSPWKKTSQIVAFRQVGGYDAYVVSVYPVAAIWRGWATHTLVFAIATLLPSLALVLLLSVSLRRLASEELTWRRLSAEATAREELEKIKFENQRLQTLGNLVATVAHDFNNLLMAISAHAQKVLRAPSSLEADIKSVLRAVGNGEALTRRLLGVARKQPLREETLHLAEWGNGFGLLRATLGDRTIVSIDIDPQVWLVRVDAAELELAILNIAINARDAMPTGGTFSLTVTNVELSQKAGAKLEGEYVCIAMTDSGAGMADDVVARAFEPFFSTKPLGSGTGVGLAQSRALCERSGGAAMLRSALGNGTTVEFYLPRAKAGNETRSPRTPEMDATQARPGRRILLVEDNDVVAEAERSLLETLGHMVDWASDAHKALMRIAAGESYDVVLSDVQMPGGITGIDLAEQLARERPTLPVALITGYVEDIERLSALKLTVFTKPFDLTELEAYLASLPDKVN